MSDLKTVKQTLRDNGVDIDNLEIDKPLLAYNVIRSLKKYAVSYHIHRLANEHTNDKQECFLGDVSQRSELLKEECKDFSFDMYLYKYYNEPTIELVYERKHNGIKETEIDIIEHYKRAYRL